VLLAEASVAAVQALVRWDQPGFADRELGERATLRLPPEARMASLTG
jgi:primosomal protein N' (replication factor Y)